MSDPSPKDAVKAVAWRAYNSNGDVLAEWVDGAPSDWDHSEVKRVQGRMEIAYSELPTVMCEGRRYEVLTPRTIAHAECIRDHANKWLKNVTGVDALSQVRKQALQQCRDIALKINGDANEAGKAKDATDYVAGYQDAAVDIDEAIRKLAEE
jgi:hypothetical protein